MPENKPITMRISNEDAEPTIVVLEPWGTIHELAAGQTRVVTYAGYDAPDVSITVSRREIKVWAESTGTLDIDDP